MAREPDPPKPVIEYIQYDEAGYEKCKENLRNYPHDCIQYQRGLEQMAEIREKINTKRKKAL
jgi:hypothetical protein